MPAPVPVPPKTVPVAVPLVVSTLKLSLSPPVFVEVVSRPVGADAASLYASCNALGLGPDSHASQLPLSLYQSFEVPFSWYSFPSKIDSKLPLDPKEISESITLLYADAKLLKSAVVIFELANLLVASDNIFVFCGENLATSSRWSAYFEIKFAGIASADLSAAAGSIPRFVSNAL